MINGNGTRWIKEIGHKTFYLSKLRQTCDIHITYLYDNKKMMSNFLLIMEIFEHTHKYREKAKEIP